MKYTLRQKQIHLQTFIFINKPLSNTFIFKALY